MIYQVLWKCPRLQKNKFMIQDMKVCIMVQLCVCVFLKENNHSTQNLKTMLHGNKRLEIVNLK